jgi:RNA polymerase sigma-70 factor (ECF subfamily)
VTHVNTTSASLLERLRRPGAADAWERFVRLYTPLLYHWARQTGLQQADASDLVQDVFLVLLEKLPEFSYDRTRNFRSWLRAVTLNKWRDRCKRRAPALLGPQVEGLEGPAEADGAALFAEEEYRRYLTARALEVAQSEFEPRTWKAVWEHLVDGKPAPQVARELGMTPGAVYAARFRLIGRLRCELDGLLD